MTADAQFMFITGFCGLRSDPTSHGRCPIVVSGVDCTCSCHTDPPALALVPAVEATRPEPASEVAPLEPGGSPHLDLGDSLTALTAAVTGLDASLLHFDGNDIETLDLLGILRDRRQSLARIESLVEGYAVKVMDRDVVEWPGGTAERRWGKDRKEWKHDELTRAVTNAIVAGLAVDRFTGELDNDLATALYEAIEKYAATNRPSWRVTAVKPLGLDPDDFCHAIPGRATVQVHLAEPPAPGDRQDGR